MDVQLIIGFGLGCLSLLFLVLVRDSVRLPAVRAILFLIIGTWAFLSRNIIPDDFNWAFSLLINTIPASFWLLSQLVFSDRKKLPAGLTILAVYSFTGPAISKTLALFFPVSEVLTLIFVSVPSYIEYILIIHGLWVILKHRSDDLVETRRQLRVRVLSVVGIVVLFNVASIKFGLGGEFVRLLLAAMAAFITAYLLLEGRKGVLFNVMSDIRLLQNDDSTDVKIIQNTVGLAQLNQIMSTGFYRTEKLTLSKLANEISLPEYKLRLLINQNLGFRNFNDYVNQLRIAEAMARLDAEPETPISNISLDIGYRTMSSFSRAFKEIAGKSPTEYRQAGIETVKSN